MNVPMVCSIHLTSNLAAPALIRPDIWQRPTLDASGLKHACCQAECSQAQTGDARLATPIV